MSEITWQISVTELSQSPYYQSIVRKIESLSPVVPFFDYKGESNIEEVKYKLAQKQFHELVMSVLKPKKGEDHE